MVKGKKGIYIKFIFCLLISLTCLIDRTRSQGGMNSCGTVGDKQPLNTTDCTSPQKSLGDGEKCCYISALLAGEPISACVILPYGANETSIKNAAERLGSNSTYSCHSNFAKISFILLLACIFLLR